MLSLPLIRPLRLHQIFNALEIRILAVSKHLDLLFDLYQLPRVCLSLQTCHLSHAVQERPRDLENLLELLVLNGIHVEVLQVGLVPALTDPALGTVPPHVAVGDLVMPDVTHKDELFEEAVHGVRGEFLIDPLAHELGKKAGHRVLLLHYVVFTLYWLFPLFGLRT